jgi:hypothetical protein
MPPKKNRNPMEAAAEVPVTCRRNGDANEEREMLKARFDALLFECDDFWSGKRGKHSHVHPIFKEYWRLVQIARDLYPENPIFEELDISEATQPNADDIQAIEIDVRKMLAVFDVLDGTTPESG